jgi:Domain of unknown function (DUF4389)
VSYPVSFEADYVERRNRLTAFFRPILAIPLAIWLFLYAIAVCVAIVIAWFAIVITGAYPRGLYTFVAVFTRFVARFTGYALLLCDPYPSFGGSDDPAYPVRMQFEQLERYSRLKTLFRIILVIPILILRYVMTLMLEIGAIAAWFVILITGKMPRRPVRPDGPRQLLHRSLRCLRRPTDRDLPPVPRRTDACGRNTAPCRTDAAALLNGP